MAQQAGGWFAGFATLIVGILGTKGYFGWKAAQAEAEPDMMGEATKAMSAACAELRAQLARMDERAAADKAAMRLMEERAEADRKVRHEIGNKLTVMEIWALKLRDVLQEALDLLVAAGLSHPKAPRNMTIADLMAGPIAQYDFRGVAQPVSDMDNGRAPGQAE